MLAVESLDNVVIENMTAEERVSALRNTHESSLRIVLPVETVRRLDEFLRDYGISEPLPLEDLDERVTVVLGRGKAKQFLRVLDERPCGRL